MTKTVKEDNDRKLRIALIQMSMQENVEKNISKAVESIKKAAKNGAKIIALPELFNTVYFPQKENVELFKKYAETIPGKTTDVLSKLAKTFKVVILAPIYEVTKDSHYFNTAVIIDENGKILDTYRKVHIPHDSSFYEKDYFEEGNTGFKVIKTTYGNIAPLICFDQWFPEAARKVALKGADIIFYPTAIGWDEDSTEEDDWKDSWITIQRSHAIANNVHVASINRVGKEDKLDFWGNSFVCDPFGKVLAKSKSDKDEIIFADIDLSDNERLRHSWGFFAKRRPETYSLLTDDKIRDTNKESPVFRGYNFPAEWIEHSAVLLSWPHDTISFPKLAATEETYVKIIKALQGDKDNERVHLLVTGPQMRKKVLELFGNANIDMSRIKLFEHDYDDVWFRDYGPTFVVNTKEKKIGMVKWTYNAYGGKYEELLKDDNVPAFLNKFMNIPYFDSGIVMEGGSVENNGKGTIITTEQCLLNKNRNPGMTRIEIEKKLKDYLNVSNIIWLKNGLKGDDTDGHVDNLARFANEKTILCTYEDDTKDVNYSSLKKNYELLCKAKDQNGKRFDVIKLPAPKFFKGKERLSASYANFYIANETVLVPQFGLDTDKIALDIISKQFGNRKVVGIDCRALITGGGTLHCITQQIPKV